MHSHEIFGFLDGLLQPPSPLLPERIRSSTDQSDLRQDRFFACMVVFILVPFYSLEHSHGARLPTCLVEFSPRSLLLHISSPTSRTTTPTPNLNRDGLSCVTYISSVNASSCQSASACWLSPFQHRLDVVHPWRAWGEVQPDHGSHHQFYDSSFSLCHAWPVVGFSSKVSHSSIMFFSLRFSFSLCVSFVY